MSDPHSGVTHARGRSPVFAVVMFAACLVFSPLRASGQTIEWTRDYAAALKSARATSVPIVVDLWATWCVPCQEMDRTVFSKPEVIDSMRRVIAVRIDVERDRRMMSKFGVNSIPTMAIVDPWDHLLYLHRGFQNANAIVKLLSGLPRSFSEIAPTMDVLEAGEDNYDALMTAARFYEARQFVSAAEIFFVKASKTTRAKAARPLYDDTQIALALVTLKRKDARAAEKIVRGALKNCDPSNEASLLMTLGFAYEQQNKRDDALKTFRQIATKFPDSEASIAAGKRVALLEGK